MTNTITFRQLWDNPQVLIGKKHVYVVHNDHKSWCANPVTHVALTKEPYPNKESKPVAMIWIGTRGFTVGMKPMHTVEYESDYNDS